MKALTKNQQKEGKQTKKSEKNVTRATTYATVKIYILCTCTPFYKLLSISNFKIL